MGTRLASQSRSTQRQIIDTARKDGTLDNLYWYVCLDLPLKYGSIANPISSGAKWRGGVPVIRVAPDPAASEAEIELLRWLFEDGNRGQGIRFYYALTTKSLLDAICPGWYVWGEANTSIDNICPTCARIHTTEHYEPWACCGWSQVVTIRR